MKNIFEQGEFHRYSSNVNLYESRAIIQEQTIYSRITTVFISHKHDDLEDLKGIIGFLESEYGVKAYIDSKDSSMPEKTSGETAKNIKDRINKCNKFILLATNGAIESKWCNWELGYGDAQKFKGNIALFPMKPKETYNYEYKGSEYMQIYPYICYYNGTEKYDGSSIVKGYYVRYTENEKNY
ncbi:MAG: toll/interleukin-1 receptor domain-containing protein, partial [Oscillospiraceae bacterium]|nr:toll/interleukin-1 receptor domain-containing protein [Oscillospiraceae bacterium]